MSDRTREMASPWALREWCRVTCARYPNVELKNMSTSFRDGLAFCAIIHKHRPDLIDFNSLSKDNVYQNNKLAFDVALTRLGIPALLHPNEMVSTNVPDCLSIITYLSQYHFFFNRKSYAGLPSLRLSHVTVLNNLTKSKTPDGLKPCKSSTDLETSREVRLSRTRQRTVCSLCFKPVHLIQRHLIDGKFYHRSCFRCSVCHSTLLQGSYTEGGDAGPLICTHHRTNRRNTHPDLNQQTGPTNQVKCLLPASYVSLGGLAVSSVPHYSKTTESQDRLVNEREEQSREVQEGENSAVGLRGIEKNHLPPSSDKDGTSEVQQKATKTKESPSTGAQVTGGSIPVPAPRRTSVPVPAPRTKTSQTMNSSPAAGNASNQNKYSRGSPHISSSSTGGSPKVTYNHPWLAIIHPGPWTQLPPAPAPVPTPRSKSVYNQRRTSYRPKVPGPNPFAEDVDEDAQEEPADQTKPSVEAIHPEDEGSVGSSSEAAGDVSQIGSSGLDETSNTKGAHADVTEAAAAGPSVTSAEAQSHILPRSVSMPATTSAHAMMEERDQVTSGQSKPACKENPFDRKPAMPKSKTFQALPSARAPAPGHGFPLIKRKVQTDQNISTENLQVEKTELDKQLEAMEQRGVELERDLRDCKNDKEAEQMLMELFSLIQERHILVRRDTELVHLTTQQKLEERQADVEYELRCLLNKPESDWSRDDRSHEQQLMDEMVTIIEQRNQIISSLDQDMQREREEDMLLASMMKSKDFQKEGLKELKKSKGKFKPIRVFKMLNHKAESNKDCMDKKS